MKKRVLAFGTLGAIMIPTIAVVSCDRKKSAANNNTNENIANDDKKSQTITQVHLKQFQDYVSALVACQTNFKTIVKDASITRVWYIKTLRPNPTNLYFLGNNILELKKRAEVVLKKIGFIDKINQAFVGKKIGDPLPKANKYNTNNFKIGSKVGAKFTYYGAPIDQATNKQRLYSSAEEAVRAFLAHEDIENSYPNKLDYFKSSGSSPALLSQFENELDAYQITKDLVDLKKAIAPANAGDK